MGKKTLSESSLFRLSFLVSPSGSYPVTITVETSGSYPSRHWTHNRHLEEREAPTTRNTDVRNVNWVDGVFFLFSQSCTRQTTDFNHPFHQRAVIHLKQGLCFFAVMTLRASQHFVSRGCVYQRLHQYPWPSSTRFWHLSPLMTTNNIADIIECPPGNKIPLHPPPLPWQLQVYNQLAYKNISLRWNANILYFFNIL